jgi:hypothetical protein
MPEYGDYELLPQQSSTVPPRPNLKLKIADEDTSAGSTLYGEAFGFVPGNGYQIQAAYPDGHLYAGEVRGHGRS